MLAQIRSWFRRYLARKRLVYISSTFADLAEHRNAVKLALEPAGFELEHMERYPAFDERPVDKCVADVRGSEYYILLVGWRYGYIPLENNPESKSITEIEYIEAIRSKRPCFVFLVNTESWPKEWKDEDAELETSPIGRFRRKLLSNHGVRFFRTPEELSNQVLQALSAASRKKDNQRRLLAISLFFLCSIVLGVATYIDISESPSITATEWLKATSLSQDKAFVERAKGSVQKLNVEQGGRDIAYLSRISGNPTAWLRFKDAYSLSLALLPKLSLAYSQRRLREDLRSGNIERIISALASLPNDSTIDAARRHFLIGAFLEVDGQVKKALGEFEKAVVLDPYNIRYSTAALNLATNTGQFDTAIALAEAQRRAFSRQQTDPRDVATVIGFEALARWFKGDRVAANRLFDEALRATADRTTLARLLNDRVPLFNDIGDVGGAEATLTQAILLYICADSANLIERANSLLNLTAALSRQGRTEEAEQYLNHVAELLASEEYKKNPFPPYRGVWHVVEGLQRIAQGNGLAAETALRNALSIYESIKIGSTFLAARAQQYLGRALILKGETSAAILELNSAVALNLKLFGAKHSEVATAKVFLADAYLESGNLRAGVRELDDVNAFVNGSGRADWRFSANQRALLAILPWRNTQSGEIEPPETVSEADMAAVEDACRGLSEKGGEGVAFSMRCWNQALIVAKNVPEIYRRTEKHATAAKLQLEEKGKKRPGFAGVWNTSCSATEFSSPPAPAR